MTVNQVGGLVGFSLLLATGQILFKKTALVTSGQGTIAGLAGTLLAAPSFWAALCLYGAATLLWIYLLQTIPLSRAYPFAALGFVIVPISSVVFFGERVSVAYVAGSALIVSGIIIASRG